MKAMAASLAWLVACEAVLIDARAMRPFSTLAAPTRVSPAPAAEHNHQQQNNQYGFHVVTSFVKRKLD
jgi:hypothetical protein